MKRTLRMFHLSGLEFSPLTYPLRELLYLCLELQEIFGYYLQFDVKNTGYCHPAVV